MFYKSFYFLVENCKATKAGLEPATSGLTIRRSKPTELLGQKGSTL